MLDESTYTVRYIVSGSVQGVGYRRFVLHGANSLNLCGWVANMDDGSVECVAQGKVSSLNDFEMLLRQGPRNATVANVECLDLNDSRTFNSFRII